VTDPSETSVRWDDGPAPFSEADAQRIIEQWCTNRRFAENLERIRCWKPDRQLSLFTYAEAYHKAFKRVVIRHIDRICAMDEAQYAAEHSRRSGGEFGRNFHESAEQAAARAAILDGLPSWGTLRRLIYARDGGLCAVCGIPSHDEAFHLGHLQDRMVGGLDVPDNLVVMHRHCNMVKPLHESAEEAFIWIDRGGWICEFAERLRPDRPDLLPAR
jgi:hypothetical protein